MDRRLVEIIKVRKHAQKDSVNILGISFDGGVLGRKGAAEGPSSIRQALSYFSNYNIELGIDLRKARVSDLGDLVPESDDVDAVHPLVEAAVRPELLESSLLVILGGDNSISLPSLRAFAGRFGSMGLVVIDSHLDLRGRIGGKPTSGSSYGIAVASISGLDARRVVEVGAHGFLNSKPYFDKAKRLGIRLFTAEQVASRGAERVAKEAYEIAGRGADAVYVSVDMDAVDLAAVSGVSAPSVGGISAMELAVILRVLGGMKKVKGVDIVELAPSLDPTGRSQVVAATCLVSLISGFAGR